MSEAQHTPGPWEATKVQDRSEYLIWGQESAALPLAVVSSDTGSSRGPRGSVKTRANAQLVAAAPQLLEALACILSHEGHLLNKYRAEQARKALEAAGLTANDAQVAA